LKKEGRVDHFDKVFCLEVAGDYACFTRPEMKVERVSYDVMTPSAARAIFEAIFWKPALKWRPTKIEVLNPIRWTSVRRNEVGNVASDRSEGLFIEDERQQRAGLFLSDVAYRIHAALEFIPPSKRPETKHPVPAYLLSSEESATSDGTDTQGLQRDENPGKYNAMFERRARKGQCFNQPYLGCREFSCSFKLVEDLEKERAPIEETRELGFMLYDLDFRDLENPKPTFFRATMEKGAVRIPAWDSVEVRR
jgi:CRISPR-associated protein Cas5d